MIEYTDFAALGGYISLKMRQVETKTNYFAFKIQFPAARKFPRETDVLFPSFR